MDKRPWKGKRVANEDIMKPMDMKKQKVGGAPISIKQKLDFRAAAAGPSGIKNTLNFGASSSSASSIVTGVRPVLDEKWQEFGDTINLNIETFRNNLSEALNQEKYNKVARLFTAALKSFVTGKTDKMSLDYRILGSMMETVGTHGDKLNHVSLHRGLLNVLCMSKGFPFAIQEALVAVLVGLLERQQTVVDKAFIMAFIYDAVGVGAASLGGQYQCTWVDKEIARVLVAIIIKPFGTVFPPLQMYMESQSDMQPMECFPDLALGKVPDAMQAEVYLEYIRPWFDCLRGENPPKALLKTLSWLCGSPEVRYFVATRLDIWLQNPKFHREAMELILFIGCNLNYPTVDSDKDVADMLIKLRNLKTRQTVQSLTTAIRKACSKSDGNIHLFVKLLIGNELGDIQNRSPTNQTIMHALFNAYPDEFTKALGVHSAFMCLFHEETCKNLRILLKELIRTINTGKICQFPFAIFTQYYYDHVTWQSQNSTKGIPEDAPLKCTHFIAQVVLMCISSLMSIRGNSFAASQRAYLGKADPLPVSPEAITAHELFNTQFRAYNFVTVEWLADNKAFLFADIKDHVRSFFHGLFLDSPKQYTTIDNPVVNETEFSVAVRLFGEAGIEQHLFIKLYGERMCSLEPAQALEVVWLLTHRVASSRRHLTGSIMKFDNSFELIDRTLKMSDHFLNARPDLPRVAHKSNYLIAWRCIILWLCAGGVVNNFEIAYNEIPMLRYLVFCILTNNFDTNKFKDELAPQPASLSESALMTAEARALSEYEAQEKVPMAHFLCLLIIREGYLRQKMFRELFGMIEQFHIAGQLAKCAQPPLLDLLVASFGPTSMVTAMVDMLHVDVNTIDILSPTCIYTMLLHYLRQPIKDPKSHDGVILEKFTAKIKELLESPDEEDSDEAISAVFSSFISPDAVARATAVESLPKIFPSLPGSEDEYNLDKITELARFEQNKGFIMELIGKAINTHLDIPITKRFIEFLCENMDVRFMHQTAKLVGDAVSKHRIELSSEFSDFFVSYIDRASSQCRVTDVRKETETLDKDMIILSVSTVALRVQASLPTSIIELLSSYPVPPKTEESMDTPNYFELLIEMWLMPGNMPKVYSRDLNDLGPHSIMTIPIRKKMLRSKDRRFVEAALHGLSETDAQAFIFTPQMSIETAEKIIAISEDNMDVSGYDVGRLSTLCLLLKGYRLNGAKSGERLLQRVNAKLAEKRFVAKVETAARQVPVPPTVASLLPEYDPRQGPTRSAVAMSPNDVQAWLKANTTPSTKEFEMSLALMNAALSEEQVAMVILNYLETTLKFFIANGKAFQAVVLLVDTAASKFPTVRTKLELLSTKILKSANPPPAVSVILKKHALQVRPLTPAKLAAPDVLNAQMMYSSFKKAGSSDKKKATLLDFMYKFERKHRSDGVLTLPPELNTVLRCLTELSADASIGEKFATSAWSRPFRKRVLYVVLRKQTVQFTGPLVIHMLYTYCKQDPFISYHELFCGEAVQEKGAKRLIHPLERQCAANLAILSSYTISDPKYSTLDVMKLVNLLEKHGGLKLILALGQEFMAVSQSDAQSKTRSSALLCINAMQQQYPSLHFKENVYSRIQLRDRIESKEECFERCERLVDQVVEVIDEQGNQMELDDAEKMRAQPPPPPPPTQPAKHKGRGRWQRDNNVEAEDPGELAWITTTVSQLNLMFNDYPHIVKIMFSKLANFISTLNAMNRKEVTRKKRALKVETILKGVDKLATFMSDDELICVEMTLANCFVLYQKHVEESSFHVRDQLAITDAILKACAAFLRKNVSEARELLVENRPTVEKICSRARDREVADMVMNSIILPPI